MALSERLAILITADPQDAIRGFERVGSTAEKELGKAESRVDKLGTGLTRFGAGALAFAGVAGGALYKFAQSSEEAKNSQLLLENTLQNSPKLAGETAGSFNDLAEAIQDKTAADGDQIVAAQAMLGTFRLTGDEIRGITPLVVDYARKFGVDLTDAAIQVGKALDGQVGALKRNGVSIDEAAYATDRYSAVSAALREQVGGFAEAEGKTFAGSVQRLKNELGDLSEGVGTGVVTAFTAALGPIQRVSGAIQGMSPETQAGIGQFAAYGAAALGAVGGLSLLAGQTIKLRDRFTTLNADTGARSLNAFGKVASGIAAAGTMLALAQGLEQVSDALDDGVPKAGAFKEQLVSFAQQGEVGSEITKLFGENLERLGDDLENAGKNKLALFDGAGIERVENAKKDIDALDKALVNLVEAGHADEAAAVFDRIATAAEEQGVSVDTVRERLGDYADALANQRAETDAAGEATGGLNESLESSVLAQDAATTAAEEAEAALEAERQAIDDLRDALLGVEQADIAYAESLNAVEDANAKVFEAQVALNDAVRAHGPESLQAKAAAEELSRAQLGLRSANLDSVTSAIALNDALGKQVAAAGGSREASDRLRGELEALKQKFPELAPQIQAHIDRLNRIPASKSTTAFYNTVGEEALDRLLGKLDRAEGNRFSTVTALFPQPPGRASGGPVFPGVEYEVGEHGPERVRFPQALGTGIVTPAATSAAQADAPRGGGGSGRPVVLQLVLPNGRAIAELVHPHLRIMDREDT